MIVANKVKYTKLPPKKWSQKLAMAQCSLLSMWRLTYSTAHVRLNANMEIDSLPVLRLMSKFALVRRDSPQYNRTVYEAAKSHLYSTCS